MATNDADKVNRTDIRPWQDAETLEWAYDRHAGTFSDVAAVLGCTRRSVSRWMERHDIYPTNPWADEDTLRRLYYDEGLSQLAIAGKYGISQDTVAYWFDKFGFADRDCPTCDESFPSVRGVKLHHKNVHGESIAGVDVECVQCGNEFNRPPSHATGDRFCDKRCWYKWRAENVVGEKHPNWKGGERPTYGTGWNEKKKQAVRDRDKGCKRCGITQEGHKRKYGMRLHVHHITPADEFDNDHERNAMDNLIALCASCHPHTEQKIT